MRVAVVNWSSRRVGGIEEYLSILIPAMHEAGLPLAFWHEMDEPSDRSRIDLPDGLLEICAADTGADLAILALRQWKPDVLYINGLTDSGVESRLLTIAPSVLFLHTYVGTCISGGKTFTRPTVTPCDRKFGWPCLLHYFPHGCGGRSPITMWQHFRRQSHQLELLGHYHAIITHSEHMRDEMTKHGLRAEIVPYPVATQAVREATSGNGAWRLLFAGRMDYLKGGSILLDALRDVAAKRPAHLTLAGDGPDRMRWEAYAREIRTPNLTTEFVGWVTQERVGALMSEADLLVVPSLWPEPFGSVGPVAGQHGLPAAAFSTGGIPQWLGDGVNGHLAPADPPTSTGLAGAIVACLGNPVHYAALRQGAREMATRFTMERHLPRLIETLERVAGSRQTV
jgi:glycosyltransferase involved in cell wall biosynthesis